MPGKAIEVIPCDAALGAELRGVDLSEPLGGPALARVRQALRDHLVVFCRDQDLTPEALIAVTRRLGPLLRVPYVAPLPEHPDIIAVLKEAEERNISTFGGTWHSDFSLLAAPPAFTLLYALEVPDGKGDTIWANMYAAFAALPKETRARLETMTAIHSGAPYGTRGPPANMNLSASIRITRGDPAADAEMEHPAVRRHPETGRKALFVNPVYTTRFQGLDAAESRALLDALQDHATQPRFTCRFRWREGSLAIWDNRCTLHMAVNDYDGRRRLLHRTTVAGERPLGPG